MKKITILASLVVAILGIAIINENVSFARLTSNSDSRDVWCVGVSGAEVCVDSSGNFIPTTDDVSDLGTSSLQFQDGYFDGTVYADVISNEGAYSGTSGTFSTTLDVNGNSTFGADNYVTTNTAASGAWAMPATLAVIGALNTDSTFDADGAVTLNSTLDVDGDVKMGAANYRSTFTATTGAMVMTGAFTSAAAVTGLSITASGGPIKPYSRSIAQLDAITPGAAGEYYHCSDCGILGHLAESTGTTRGAFVISSSNTMHIQ